MKSIQLLVLLFLAATQLHAQNLSIERIWKNYEFTAKGAGSYQAMNDGLHFIEMNQNGDIVSGLIADDQQEKTEILVPKSLLV